MIDQKNHLLVAPSELIIARAIVLQRPFHKAYGRVELLKKMTNQFSRRLHATGFFFMSALAFVVTLGGCANMQQASLSFDRTYTSKSQDSRVQYIIVHFTTIDLEKSIRVLTEGAVSSHYLVSDNPPTVYQFVDENRRAFHAGVSSWKNASLLNGTSIGIEIVGLGYKDTPEGRIWYDFPKAQIDTVIALIKDIAKRHDVKPDRILGHSDIAPGRKNDPGPKFPWKRLADEGIIPWPDSKLVAQRRAVYEQQLPDIKWFQQKLAQHGYATPQTEALDKATRDVMEAFQMRFRPAKFDGQPDAESAAILDVLTMPALPTSSSSRPVNDEVAHTHGESMSSYQALAPTVVASLNEQLRAIQSDPGYSLASLSVLAIRDGKIAYRNAFGHRFIDATNPAAIKPANADTLYRIASISKLITTIGVMRLVEDGKINLDRDISDYLGYVLRNPNFPNDPITTRMLLTHTSSLRDDGGYYWEAKNALKDVLLPGGALYGKGEMWAKNAKPGAYFQYANLPWGVLGTVMERATRERFDRLMKRYVFEPLGVSGGFNPADFLPAELENVATLYRKRTEVAGKEIWDRAGPWMPQVDDYSKSAPVPRADTSYVIGSNGTAFGPQGGARISVNGLGTLMLMLMNNGQHNGRAFLSKTSVDEMLRTQWQANGKTGAESNGQSEYGGGKDLFNAWGLGTQIFVDKSGQSRGDRLVEGGGFTAVGHLGDAWGLTSAFVFNRATKRGMIFLHGGPSFDPDTYPGQYSALFRHEERILSTLYQHAIEQKSAR
jgi:N-acetyl-anhydromuramyl-L-alanine amidase AmpD/CubicO group peptidase (beta-lactamase class C family)